MPDSDLRALLAKCFDDQEFEASLKASGADPVAIAAEAGFTITAEEFNNALQSWENWRITAMHDEEA